MKSGYAYRAQKMTEKVRVAEKVVAAGTMEKLKHNRYLGELLHTRSIKGAEMSHGILQ